MTRKIPLILIFCLLTGVPAIRAERKMDVKKIKKMERAAIIRMAGDEIKKSIDPDFEAKNFDRVSVLAGKNEVLVSFSMSVRYVPWQSAFLYDASVIFSKQIMLSCGPVVNPENFKPGKEPVFFKPSPESWEATDFILDAVNRSKEVGPLPDKKIPQGSVMTIYEHKGHYQVLMLSEHTESFYKVNRKTGQVYDASHNHLEAEPGGGNENYREIK